MPRDGSGNYNLPAGNPVVFGTDIDPVWANTTLDDIRSALTQSVSKDGQTTMTGNLNFGGNGIKGLSSGTAAAPSVSFLGSATTGIYSPATNELGFACNGVARGSVSGAGNWTLNAASSGVTLTVSGSASFSGNVSGPDGIDASHFVTKAQLDVIASSAGVSSFNGRTGAVSLLSSDVTTALGYTPANKAGDTFTGSVSAPLFNATGATIPSNGIYLPSANTLGFASNGAARGSVSNAGNWTINSASSGNTFTINTAPLTNALVLQDGTTTMKFGFSSGPAQIGTFSYHDLQVLTNNAIRLTIDKFGVSTFDGSVSAPLFNATGATIPSNGIYLPSANTLGFASNGIARGFVSNTGNWTLSGVSSGYTLTVGGGSSLTNMGWYKSIKLDYGGVIVMDSGLASSGRYFFLGATSDGNLYLGNTQLEDGTTGANYSLTVSANRNWTLKAPASGTTLTLNSVNLGAPLYFSDGTRTGNISFDANNAWIGTTTNHGFMLFSNNTARLNVSNDGTTTCYGAARTSPSSVAFSATPTFDAKASNVFYFGTLTGNVTSTTISNAIDGQTIQIRFVQDATGGRTVALPSGAVVSGSINTVANTVTWLVMTYVASAGRWEGTWTRVN